MSEWQSVEDFQKEANEGLCWIVYKGRVVLAYHSHKQDFVSIKLNNFIYMTECISSVMAINPPEKPSKL